MKKQVEPGSVPFDPSFLNSEYQISYIGTGSFGGKARGLANINSILEENFNPEEFPGFRVNIPKMLVIRTDIFDAFMKQNNLNKIAYSGSSDERIALAFQKSDLPFEILGDLRNFISKIQTPLAIRSSSMLEDAIYEPFAGVYGTKMTPNNQLDTDSRFRKLVEGIKYVYASTFFKASKDYIDATKHENESEKMAVIIQEVVGKRHEDRYYPEISGVARSYNFYPVGHAKPEDAVVNLALGLGKTIVDGGISWSFSPAYPTINPPFGSPRAMLNETQTQFWSINMGKPPEYNPINEAEFLVQDSLKEAEADGTLKHISSTYDLSSDRIWPGASGQGPKILTFSPILLLDTIPLNNLVKKLLEICEKSLNTPVEIEFALTLSGESDTPYRFGFLQVRPMVVSTKEVEVTDDEMGDENVIAASQTVLGNGIIDSIKNIIYLNPETFETRSTQQIADEIGAMNKRLIEKKEPYLLIGYGRWGTSDPSAGVPVKWGQVSGAKVIIEATLENIHVEMSQGSHFFHNVTGFEVCYFSIPFAGIYKVDWDWLAEQKLVEETRFVKHIKLEKPLKIKVDGRRSMGVILKS
ncbi:MAG: PEP/pyruvate-binding domain-containing protein [Bacteroidales bacterium]|nr:PEP/pyruvate-binding domain-containing protein [Bacteroidales bacterium]